MDVDSRVSRGSDAVMPVQDVQIPRNLNHADWRTGPAVAAHATDSSRTFREEVRPEME
jgi:hypothetical protein